MKKIALTLVAAFLVLSVFGQARSSSSSISSGRSSSKGDWMDRVFFQPGLGLGFAKNSAFVNVGLTAGYKITEKLAAGVGPAYTYYKYQVVDSQGNVFDVNSVTWSGNIFTRYMVLEQVYVIGQYELMTTKYSVKTQEDFRKNYGAFFVGAGYVQQMSRNGAFYIQGLYNLSYDDSGDHSDNGPYNSPFVLTLGFMVGF